jgi:hypothetical protein
MSSAILPWSIPFVKWGLGRVKEYRDEWAPDVKIMGYIGGLLLTIHNSDFTNTQAIVNFLWAVLGHPAMKDAELASLNIFNEPGIDFPAVDQLANLGPRYEAVVEFNRSEEDDLVFPSSPTVGQIYGRWRWDGRKWVARFSHPAQ